MTELFLKFVDKNGEERKVSVEYDNFLIGRHSENDLVLNYPGISRDHAKIDRFANIFVLSDRGSSHGTTLNGEKIGEPTALKNEDVINLGGDFELTVECVEEESKTSSIAETSPNLSQNNSSKTSGEGVSWGWFFIIAPLFGFLILIVVGIGIWAFSGKSKPSGDGDFVSSIEKTPTKTPEKEVSDDSEKTPTSSPNPKKSRTPESTPKSATPESSEIPASSETPKDNSNSDLEKLRNASTSFLKTIGAPDETPFLLQKQLNDVNAKIKSYRGSSALRDNLRTLARGISSVKSKASENGLKPALVGVSALAKLDNNRGDASSLAGEISAALSKYGVVLGRNSANDNLLILAAEHQGIDPLTMRGKLEVLAIKNSGVNVTTLRTVWFLREKDELNSDTYNFLIRFAALGTIAQNPKDFGIDAESLNF